MGVVHAAFVSLTDDGLSGSYFLLCTSRRAPETDPIFPGTLHACPSSQLLQTVESLARGLVGGSHIEGSEVIV